MDIYGVGLNMGKKYQIVARYDDYIVVVDANCYFRDFSSKKIIFTP